MEGRLQGSAVKLGRKAVRARWEKSVRKDAE
jgi:hypothetical protein